MSIEPFDLYARDFASGIIKDTNSGGDYVLYDDHIKIVDEQLAEIASLKAELFTLMSSLETWDEEFK